MGNQCRITATYPKDLVVANMLGHYEVIVDTSITWIHISKIGLRLHVSCIGTGLILCKHILYVNY